MIRERLVEVIENLAPTPIAWIAIVVGVFVHFVGFFLFKIKVPGFSDFKSPEAYVSYVTLDADDEHRDLRDQALLSDSLPLFLPSEFDYGWEKLQPSYYLENQNSSMLVPFHYEIGVAPIDIVRPESRQTTVYSPMQLLDSSVWESFRTLGEEDSNLPVLPKRFGVIEFQDEATRVVIAAFPVEKKPADVDLTNVLWKPVSVLISVGNEGSLGSPFLCESSGIVALDQYLVQEVQRLSNLRLVATGYYRVVFGP